MKLLEPFQKDLFKTVKKTKFSKISCEFQDKLNSDLKVINRQDKRSHRVMKHSTTKEKYEQLVNNSITNTYKKVNSTKTISDQNKN